MADVHSLPKSPYKFLDYYDVSDRDIFEGRATEIQILLSDIVTARLVVLFAPTGSGKSSLINAGVRPRLEELDYRTYYIRVERDPTESCRRVLREKGLIGEARDQSLAGQLSEAAATRPIVLFFDQFEEFFIYVLKKRPQEADQFIRTIGALHRNRRSGVHVVFSLRDEFFVSMNAFREEVPTIFHNDTNLELKWFDAAQAERVIVEPARKFGVSVERPLVEKLIQDLWREDGVEPASLQIVCDTLWRHRAGGTLPLELYQRLNGAHQILNHRLEEDVSNTLDNAQLELFERLVPRLSSEYGTKAIQPLNEVARELGEDPSAVTTLIEWLSGLRLVRVTTRESEAYVEWTTDYLSDPKRAGDWRARVRSIRLARMLASALSSGSISLDDFNDISEGAPLLTDLGPRELDFLLNAALEFGQNMTIWFQRASAGGVPVWNRLGEHITSQPHSARAGNTVLLLGNMDQIEAADLLAVALSQPALSIAARAALETISRSKTRGEQTPAARHAEALLQQFGSREPEPHPVLEERGKDVLPSRIGRRPSIPQGLPPPSQPGLNEADWDLLIDFDTRSAHPSSARESTSERFLLGRK